MANEYLYQKLTAEIIRRFYIVYNKLGYGFLEKVYERAMKFELEKAGFNVERQKPINVYYDSELVGKYFADLFVEKQSHYRIKGGRDTL